VAKGRVSVRTLAPQPEAPLPATRFPKDQPRAHCCRRSHPELYQTYTICQDPARDFFGPAV